MTGNEKPCGRIKSETEHPLDRFPGAISDLFRYSDAWMQRDESIEDFFQAGLLHIRTDGCTRQWVALLGRAFPCEAVKDADFRADDKFFSRIVADMPDNPGCARDLISKIDHFRAAFRMHQDSRIWMKSLRPANIIR